MTAQERQRTAPALDFESWKPYLLSPKLARANYRRSGIFVFGGCGFFLFLMLARATGYVMLWSFALMWDCMVLMTFGTVWLYVVPIAYAVRWVKRKREARVTA